MKGTTKAEVGKIGVKYDTGKTRHDLQPFLAIECVSVVLTDGAIKYSDNNWRKGISWGRLIRAALGHIFRYAIGEDNDRETGLPHPAHAACCILFLLEYYLVTKGGDDRYSRFDDRYKLSPKVLNSLITKDNFRGSKKAA